MLTQTSILSRAHTLAQTGRKKNKSRGKSTSSELCRLILQQAPPDRELRSVIDCLRTDDNFKFPADVKSYQVKEGRGFGAGYLNKVSCKNLSLAILKILLMSFSLLLLGAILLVVSWCNGAVMKVMGASETARVLHANMMWGISVGNTEITCNVLETSV